MTRAAMDERGGAADVLEEQGRKKRPHCLCGGARAARPLRRGRLWEIGLIEKEFSDDAKCEEWFRGAERMTQVVLASSCVPCIRPRLLCGLYTSTLRCGR